MATGYEKFDKQLDRLEKLFSRKKRAAYSHDSAATGIRPTTPMPFLTNSNATTAQAFPVPPYLRPTSSRMMAREEVLLQPLWARRARSLPESPSAPRIKTAAFSGHNTDEKGPSIPARHSSGYPGIAQRPSSPYPGSNVDDPSTKLLQFSFSTASRESECNSSPRRSRPSVRSHRSPSVSVSPRARLDRKRCSTEFQQPFPSQGNERGVHGDSSQSENPSALPSLQREERCSGTALSEHSSPSLSPSLPSKDKPKLGRLNSRQCTVSHRQSSLSISGTTIRQLSEALRESTSLSQLSRARDTNPNPDPILKEPSVNDFLSLSDDDIADEHAASRVQLSVSDPPTFPLPPNPSPASSPIRTRPAFPLLTLSPPLASRPAAAAAIEAARIAAKYKFDLVYVVNLWPSHISRSGCSSPSGRSCGTPHPASPSRTTPFSPPGSPDPTTPHPASPSRTTPFSPPGSPDPTTPSSDSDMTGRLLAAYGLSSITCPFRISAPVHQNVLRSQGWLEYRNETGARDEFACGYSCSFYTGYSPVRGHGSDAASSEGQCKYQERQNQDKPANRGIVFAAFRVPREDGSPVFSNATELEALHKDAEALVDMLINTRTARWRRRAPTTPSRWRVAGGSSQPLKPSEPPVAI
ncbi:hypothetical protein MYCTH_114083 [Thermothelomyces thermophilus ATCC 42464]|uniref:Uncharacterized protein n=1 Tax=Thermothelomyces thermophilus (strain ATCC 42464 / BCRC 31852 / DSM 1799) TaxID=573729 RepID=G2Q5V0_THET4|nr:uncharacterized protein MYCTH_114083 [Thermothelomyces thermophilus ATCC 42464]AEO53826.1 hypothetical protein MYCTH_114083 [Thermothelomyces thermophilus ATCC 42464]